MPTAKGGKSAYVQKKSTIEKNSLEVEQEDGDLGLSDTILSFCRDDIFLAYTVEM